MMTHEQALERLDDFAGGELPDGERREVQRHLEGCADCRAEVDALRALLDEARFLPKTIAPPRDLWAGIAPRLQPRAETAAVAEDDGTVISLDSRRRRWQPPRWAMSIAAALALMLGSSLATVAYMRSHGGAGTLDPVAVAPPAQSNPAQSGPSRSTSTQVASNGDRTPDAPMPNALPETAPATADAPQTALAAFRPAEREYNKAIDELATVFQAKRAQLAPETVATLERNLRIIDAAIAESRAALEKDPNSRELTQMLSAVYDSKVQMLQQAVEL